MKILRTLMRNERNARKPEPWTAPYPTATTCSLDSLTAFYQHLVATAREHPEGVGYADFTVDDRPCGVEAYCAPLRSFYSCLSIDHEVVHIDRGTLAGLLADLVIDEEIDDIRVAWQVRFYAPERVPDALYRILRRICDCREGVLLQIDQWWS